MPSLDPPLSTLHDSNGSVSETSFLRIAIVCDFFYPRLGGVEAHIFALAQCLVQLGHKVVVITHEVKASPNDGSATNVAEVSHIRKRTSVRYLPGPIKVYYCPFLPMSVGACLPTFLVSFPLLRHILVRERINIVHAHQATSTLGNESVVYASTLGLASVYTDHSLFGFNDVASIVLNEVLAATLSTVDACIAVSHTCRENLILRARLDPQNVFAIPNAVDTSKFQPPSPPNTPRKAADPDNIRNKIASRQPQERIKIIVLSRLVYRKGIDLLVPLIPAICSSFPHVDFIIGGDGSKRLALEEMVERYQLQHRVEFLGAVANTHVRSVLCRGHLFLNCSLTESFCIAILEAASVGLFVIATDVGGVHEVQARLLCYAQLCS
jgi:phosphatidylinositol glycan class A protein